MEGNEVGGVDVSEASADQERVSRAEAGDDGDAPATEEVTSDPCPLCGVQQHVGLMCGRHPSNVAASDCLPQVTRAAREMLNASPGPMARRPDPAAIIDGVVARLWRIIENRDEPPEVRAAALQALVTLPRAWRP